MQQLLEIFLHLDKHLGEWAGALGNGLYALLFAIVHNQTLRWGEGVSRWQARRRCASRPPPARTPHRWETRWPSTVP